MTTYRVDPAGNRYGHFPKITKSWSDEEPDTLTVEVQEDFETKQAFVVFVGNATWLTPNQVREVEDWLRFCRNGAEQLNRDLARNG